MYEACSLAMPHSWSNTEFQRSKYHQNPDQVNVWACFRRSFGESRRENPLVSSCLRCQVCVPRTCLLPSQKRLWAHLAMSILKDKHNALWDVKDLRFLIFFCFAKTANVWKSQIWANFHTNMATKTSMHHVHLAQHPHLLLPRKSPGFHFNAQEGNHFFFLPSCIPCNSW